MGGVLSGGRGWKWHDVVLSITLLIPIKTSTISVCCLVVSNSTGGFRSTSRFSHYSCCYCCSINGSRPIIRFNNSIISRGITSMSTSSSCIIVILVEVLLV